MLGVVSETPPPYAQYPRGVEPGYGSATALRSLFDGYNGLSRAFLINIAMVIPINLLARAGAISLPLVGLLAIVVFAVIFAVTLGPNKKIGEGAGWVPAQPLIASSSALCCGIIGYVVMQTIAANHIKKFGLRRVKKSEVQAKIAELESAGTGIPRF